MGEKTLNLHLTDKCNFHCKHCFVKMQGYELNLEQCKKVIDRIYEMNEFTRINLAGGEPTMVHHLQEVIDYIVNKGFKCSIITNGSYLTEEFITKNRNKLCMIGISIDSMDDSINKLIGRKTIKNLVDIAGTIKENNILLKINICVTKNNLIYDFKSFLSEIKPDRLKLFQVMVSPYTKYSDALSITDDEFKDVCQKLIDFSPVCEDHDYIANSYWIVDSEGYYGKDNLHSNHNLKTRII